MAQTQAEYLDQRRESGAAGLKRLGQLAPDLVRELRRQLERNPALEVPDAIDRAMQRWCGAALEPIVETLLSEYEALAQQREDGGLSGTAAACEWLLARQGYERCEDSRAHPDDLVIAAAAQCSACGAAACGPRVYAEMTGRFVRLLVVCGACLHADEL